MDKMFVVRNFTTHEFYGKYKNMTEDITLAKFFKYKSLAQRAANRLTAESTTDIYIVETVGLELLGIVTM